MKTKLPCRETDATDEKALLELYDRWMAKISAQTRELDEISKTLEQDRQEWQDLIQTGVHELTRLREEAFATKNKAQVERQVQQSQAQWKPSPR